MGGSNLDNIVLIIMVVSIIIVIITTQNIKKTIPTSDSHTVCISLRCRPIHVSILLQVNLRCKSNEKRLLKISVIRPPPLTHTLLVYLFYFVACDNKADVGTKHLFQFLHPALHLIETIEKQLGSIFDMKDIFFKPKTKINLVETVFVCYVVDKDGPCSRSIENCHNCHFYHHRDRLKRSHYHHSLHRGSLGSRSDQEHEIFLGPPCPILRGGPYIDI